ncbi:GNAT family N-acetyltransferase [Legionella sp. km772]|uniref:GNAT family N-acetyltransferase n=1 Tax=Legionella sp. km772 TaxID=2498111 RepID=UPI000F8E7BB1|nr:GNAT family N-acetyltransferase [Legionella sp. km772]RUR11644.1 N-acetyltransferase [Legionella sp. km772]
MKPFLTTKRLIIAAPSLHDFKNLYILQSNAEVMNFIGNGVRNENEVRIGLEKAINHFQKHHFSLGSLYCRKSDEFIGRAGLIYFNYDAHQLEVEVAYALLPHYWGMGFATEITASLIQFAFQNLKLPKLIALVHPENISSQKVLIKCGMHNVGRIEHWNKKIIKFELINKS